MTKLSFGRLGRHAVSCLGLTIVVLGCTNANGSSASGAALGSKPDFRLKTMDGRVIGPVDFPGKVVVVDFWATWCGPCQIQSAIISSLSERFPSSQVVFLAADVGESEETVRSFVRSSPSHFPILLDPDNKVSDALGVQGLPTLMVVDRTGRIAAFRTGLTDADSLKRFIQQASL
jgi:thiol-disulfide isomerase/thioredoxin